MPEPLAPLDPRALPIEQVARLLSRASGSPVTREMIEADLAAGAPRNPNGSINLVHYAAWLAKEAGRGE